MKKLLSIILLIGLTSITSLSAQEIIQTKVLKEIQEYNTEDFVVNVTDILVKDQNIFLSDQGLTAIIKTDDELSFISKFGERGLGPNEMEKPKFLLTDRTSRNIYVLDSYHRKGLEYSEDGTLVGSPFTFGTTFVNRALVENGIFYYTSSIDQEFDIKVYDIPNREKRAGLKLEGAVKSGLGRDLFSYQGQFLSIMNYNPPVIELFNKDWELTNTFELSENPQIAKRISFKKPSGISMSGPGASQVKLRASGEVIIKCSRIFEDKLYLLASTMDGREDTIINTIFTYEFQKDTWVQKGQINLPEENSYSTFALVDNRRIVAFEWESSTIQLLELVR